MATYSNGDSTFSAILAASKQLFFDCGYAKTNCSTIAHEAGVNQGLIHYHYKSKRTIALTIFVGFFESCRDIVRELFPTQSVLVRNAVETIFYWMLLEKSEAFRRFVCEISLERIPLEMSIFTGFDYFSSINAESGANLSDKTLELFCNCSFAAEAEMILQYSSHTDDFTAEYMSGLDILMLFELFSLPYDQIKQITAKARSLCSSYSIDITPEFVVSISENKR